MSVEPTSIKEVKRMNAVVARNSLQEQEDKEGGMKKDSYVMDVDREKNCYNCRGFGHLAQNYRNWEIIDQGRRIEYSDNSNNMNNLKEKENLVVLD